MCSTDSEASDHLDRPSCLFVSDLSHRKRVCRKNRVPPRFPLCLWMSSQRQRAAPDGSTEHTGAFGCHAAALLRLLVSAVAEVAQDGCVKDNVRLYSNKRHSFTRFSVEKGKNVSTFTLHAPAACDDKPQPQDWLRGPSAWCLSFHPQHCSTSWVSLGCSVLELFSYSCFQNSLEMTSQNKTNFCSLKVGILSVSTTGLWHSLGCSPGSLGDPCGSCRQPLISSWPRSAL